MSAPGGEIVVERRYPLVHAAFPIAHSARILDAVLMGLLVYRLPTPFLPGSVPLAQTALAALVLVSLFRRPTRRLGRAAWYPWLCLALLAFVLAGSSFDGLDALRRAANIALVMLTAGFLASGRIDVVSGLKGLAAALSLNAVLFVAGLAPDSYQGALTGFLQDKNVAGLVYGAAALLVSALSSRLWLRIGVLALGAGAVVATDSRTSMAAYACALVWLIAAPHLRLLFRALLGGGLVLLFLWAERNLATAGDYGVERAGSDALRARILDASVDKVALSPWTGSGLGEATARVDGIDWFFHNSYLALMAEGGVVLLVGVIGTVLVAGFATTAAGAGSRPGHAVGAASILVLLCATQLGEVFFAPISFVVIGAGLALLAEQSARARALPPE